MTEIETRTIGKVTRRLVPFLIVCYFVAYLDRVNVGFAALQMKPDLGISDVAYGLGAGIFFLSYFIFEVPSNLMLERFGARRWIARIMFTWGILSGAMAFIGGVTGFYVVRTLLGAAEAGFFPGIIFFLTLWFPSIYRARIVGFFMAAIPASTVIGAPLSGILLYLDGFAGLRGWQWMFIIEAVPALILSVVVLTYLTDRPADAKWLETDERSWLAERLAAEERARHAQHHQSVMKTLGNPKVLALGLVYFGAVACNYGVGFWLPQIVKNFGLTNLQTGFVTAIPYVIGMIGMIFWGMRSDRRMERKMHAAIPLGIAALGIGCSALVSDPTTKMLLLTIGGFGVFAVLPVFWTLPTSFLSGASAAAGIAIINAIGNLSGFAGPYAMGWLKTLTGSFSTGLLLIASLALIAMLIVLSLHHDEALERAPQRVPAE